MQDVIDGLIVKLQEFRPHILALDSIQDSVSRANASYQSLTHQIKSLKAEQQTLLNKNIKERTERTKALDDDIHSKNEELILILKSIDDAKIELVQVQNDIAKFNRRLEELAAKVNKTERSLA